MRRILWLACALVLISACGEQNEADDTLVPKPGPSINEKNVVLVPFKSCDDFVIKTKAQMIEEMESIVDTNRGLCNYNANYPDPVNDMPTTGAQLETNFTDTNVQEAGVDEADIVKTDGKYLYVLSVNRLEIIRVGNFEKFGRVAYVPLSGSPVSLYLNDDVVVVFSNVKASYPSAGLKYIGGKTKLTFVNVSNPYKPVVIRESTYDGQLVDSRRVNNMVHMVLNAAMPTPVSDMNYYIDRSILPDCKNFQKDTVYPAVEAAIAKLKKTNTAEINNWKVKDYFPKAEHRFQSGSTINKGVDTNDCRFISQSEAVNGQSMMELITIDSNHLTGDDKMVTILDNGGTAYASKDSIYISSIRNRWPTVIEDGEKPTEETIIHRFTLGDGQNETAYFGSGAVPGNLLNQFSLSEFQGFLRVATTMVFSAGYAVNGVYTMDVSDVGLPIKGRIEDLAVGETIYAVRFIGSRGFVVTFKKVDPLFTIDLSNPEEPKVKGELEVPGFSTYLHPLDENHLLGLGMNADDMGSFAWFQGMQLSMFDVEDMSNPSRLYNVEIGSRGTNSEAISNHHAFTYDAERGILSLPINFASGGTGGSSYGTCEYSGVHLYKVSPETGIDPIGVIKRTDMDCYAGWMTESSNAKRSILINDDSEKEGIIVIWRDRVDLYDLNELTLINHVNVSVADGYNDYIY